jgi:hypothetical protein
MATQIPLDLLKEAAFQAGIEEEDIREFDYNGRYYAANCFGVVGSMRDFAGFLLEVERADDEGLGFADALADALATDNMGMSMIFYFPGIQPYEEDDDGA